jgi:hypothetical protein
MILNGVPTLFYAELNLTCKVTFYTSDGTVYPSNVSLQLEVPAQFIYRR